MKNHNLQKIQAAVAVLTVSLLLAACGDKTAAKDERSVATGATAKEGHHDEGGEKLTHYSDRSELFLEFPPLVAGQPSGFAAHVTQLSDFKPVAEGRLTVVLSGGGAPEERFIADAPATPGIFKPVVTPKAAGERTMALIVESKLGALVHELGTVTVFADAKAAKAAKSAHEKHDGEAEGIPFGKEQQWKIDFATVEATKGVARPSIAATGIIKAAPGGEAQIVAPATGVLRASGAFPQIGQAVKKGQVLALLTPRLGGDSDQATLEAAAGRARIGLEQARLERERMEALFKDEAIAEKRLLEARANERIAEAEARAAEARASGLGGGGGGIALKSPIDGVIADVAAAAGAFVNEGAPLVHVANTGKLWLEARIPESDSGRIGKPVGAAFKVDGYAPDFSIEDGRNGRLVAVGGVIDAQTRTLPVVFEFDNPDGGLRLGLTVRAQVFAGGGQEAVLIPASAVQDENGTQTVYVQTGGETFERRIVQTGPRDGALIAVLAGIESGQRVVRKGAYLIRLSTTKAASGGHAH